MAFFFSPRQQTDCQRSFSLLLRVPATFTQKLLDSLKIGHKIYNTLKKGSRSQILDTKQRKMSDTPDYDEEPGEEKMQSGIIIFVID